MTRKIASFALMIVLAAVGTLFAGSPAQAYFSCPDTSRCAFAGYSGSGTRNLEADGQDRPGCFNVANNQIASVDNIVSGDSHNLRLFRDSDNCTGDSGLVYAGTQGNMAGIHYKSANSVYVY